MISFQIVGSRWSLLLAKPTSRRPIAREGPLFRWGSRFCRCRRWFVSCRACRFGCRYAVLINSDVRDFYGSKRPVIAGITGHTRDLLHQCNRRVVALAEDGVTAVQM